MIEIVSVAAVLLAIYWAFKVSRKDKTKKVKASGGSSSNTGRRTQIK